MDTGKRDVNANIHYGQRAKGQRRKSLVVDLENEDKLEVEELTRGLRVRSDKPHLVSLGGGRLSTAITLLPLDEGLTRIGSGEDQDVRIHGPDIRQEHCYIENNLTVITLYPLNTAIVTIDGETIEHSAALTQGCMLCLGRANYFRFNHPEQAMKMRGSQANASTTSMSSSGHSQTSGGEGGYCNKGQSDSTTVESYTESSEENSDGTNQQSPKKYRDNLTEQSFKNKLKRFETLAAPQQDDNSPMSPPTTTPTPNLSKFSYLNYVGEKLFTKDTNTTRLSMDEAQINAESASRTHSKVEVASEYSTTPVTNGATEHQQTRSKPPEIKPKPVPGFGKPKPRIDSIKSSGMSGTGRSEFKTLSMISTETSIWGSTSSAGTVRLDDELSSPISCNTPIELEDALDHPDVFGDEMTNSLSLKHQQMIEERKLEEAMEKKEQERLEEILAMCAQYEEQIDSEIQINTPALSTINKSQLKDNPKAKGSPPKSLGLINVHTSNYGDGSRVSPPTCQMPDVLSDSFHSMMSSSSSSFSDRRNIKTNGSLIQSPTSPAFRTNGDVFNYNNNSSKMMSTSNPTYSNTAYQDDSRVYDCPADYDIKPRTQPSLAPHGMVLNSSMAASIYADDNRIYDDPAEVMILPPPVPSHSHQDTARKSSERRSSESGTERHPHRSMDSSSSELTVVSCAGSYKITAPELSTSFSEQNKPEEICDHIDSLRTNRSGIIERLGQIKAKIMEVETQQSEAVRELEMEQALLQGEQQSELNKLQAQWEEGDMLKSKRIMVMNNYAKQQQERSQKIEEAREKLQRMEERRVSIEEQLRVAPDEEKDDLLLEYENELDALESQKKVFEDLEFQQLEMEAKYEEESEAVQRELNDKQSDLVSKIRRAEDNLAHMTKQQTDMMEQTRFELDDMEMQRKMLVSEFQREKQRMLTLDSKIRDVQRHYGNGVSANHYLEHDEMLLASPAATLSRSLLARMKPGDILMEEERRRLESLKHAATEASILQWHEQRNMENNLRRFGTLDSEEENMSTRSSETPSDTDKISYNSSMDDQERFAELQLLLAQARHHVQNAESTDLAVERKLRFKLEQELAEEKSKREELEQQVQLREKNTPSQSNMRPLTRYLPVREEKFDLRNHVETTGHHLGTCPFVEVTPTQCKGYLLKMGTKVKTWNKRWFVFDREKKALLYFIDKSESKPRGGIYFQSIEDVFVDHMRNVKSPNQKFTFCVKTYDKPYYLVAKSPEALSIWIDVIFTGAEGYQEF